MSSSLLLAQQEEPNLDDGTRTGQWEDDDDSGDSERHMGEQSALAMDESFIAGLEEDGSFYLRSPRDLDLPDDVGFDKKLVSLHGLLEEEDERSFGFGDLPDSDLIPFTESRSGILADSSQRHDGILEDLSASPYWQPLRDRQLDMTEDEQERGSSAGSERQGVYDGDGSGGEGYPDLPYDSHYESDYSLSPEAIQESQNLYKEYRKTLEFVIDGGKELWEPSSTSPGQSKAHADVSNKSDVGSEANPNQCKTSPESFHEFPEGTGSTSTGVSGSLSQLGDTMAFPTALSTPLVDIGRETSPLTDSSIWNLNESLHSHDKPGIDAETFPEFSYADSVEESVAVVPKISTRRTSLSLTQMLSPSKPFKKLEEPSLPSSPAPQQVGPHYLQQVQKLKKAIPVVLPSKHTRQSRSLSPNMNAAQSQSSKTAIRRSSPSTESIKYGRGQLNYPLPDFSKVEPRVKFPKDDQSYRPPRGHSKPRKPQESEAPLVFKSPAEIVREVLLSSGEGSPQKMATSDARIPDEFKSPKQATELVHQLQEDYNKLLTKYAEAENTIDLLRLGAKVNLYADPPKPSHSVQMGAVSQGSKVMAFTIPQARTAEFSRTPTEMLQTSLDSGSHLALRDHGASVSSNSQAEGFLPADGKDSTDGPSAGDCLTSTLAKQAERFQAQVESFQGLIKTKKLTPLDQLKGFQHLMEAQDSLERAYLQAREENRQLQQLPSTLGPHGEFDPDRQVEGEIFRLGVQLEELKESVDLAVQSHFSPRFHPEPAPAPSHTLMETPVSDSTAWLPTPSPLTPLPAVYTPYPENTIQIESCSQGQVEMEVSSASSEGEDEGLPEPLHHKELQVEKEFDNLLDQYNNFKTLPEAMDLEKGQEDRRKQQEADSFSGDALCVKSWRRPSLKEERSQTAPQPQPMERKPSLQRDSQETVLKSSDPPSDKRKELLSQRSASSARPLTANPKSSSRSPQGHVSRRESAADSLVSQHLPRKAFPQAKTLSPEERILSPETDSGFVGSESSRVSPLAQPSGHRASRSRLPSAANRLVMVTNSPSPRQNTNPEGSAEEPLKTSFLVHHAHPRSNGQKHGVTQDTAAPGKRSPPISSLRWANSVTGSEMGQNTESTHTDSEVELHSTASIYEPLPDSGKSRSTSWSPLPSPPQRKMDVQMDVVCSRLARDQAIQALQSEVLQLRRRLEDSLYRPQSELAETSGTIGQAAEDSWSPGHSSLFGKYTEGCPEEIREAACRMKTVERVRLASLPQDGPEPPDLELGLESDRCLSRSRDRKYRRAWSLGHKPQRPHDAFTFKGPFTGSEYPMQAPGSLSPGEGRNPTSCVHCQGTGTTYPVLGPVSMGDLRRSVLPDTPKSTPCPLCRGSKTDAIRTTSGKPSHGGIPVCSLPRAFSEIFANLDNGKLVLPDEGTDSMSPQNSAANPTAEKQQRQLGFWFMPGAPTPAAPVTCIPTVPLVPYSSHIVYSPSPASTSPPPAISHFYYTNGYQVTELYPRATRLRRRSLTMGTEDMEDLSWSLSRALEAAKDVKKTTKKICLSLTSDLSQSRSLRGSCLF